MTEDSKAAYLPLRLRAAAHEVRCWECRVSWFRWALRLITPSFVARAMYRRVAAHSPETDR